MLNIFAGAILLIAPAVYSRSGEGVFLLLYLAISAICMVTFLQIKKPARITITDLVVTVFLLYSFLNLIFIRPTQPDPVMVYRWIMFIGVYVVVRNMENKHAIVWFIVLSGLIQTLIGIVQFCGNLPSYHSDFTVTGMFPNPGPYAGFLALSLVATVWLVKNQSQYRYILWGIAIAILIMLIVTESRAAWMAAGTGLVLQFPAVYEKRSKIIVIAVACFIVVGLYFYRVGSADARLLIWRVCIQLIENKPIAGHGVGILPLHYMRAQAEYFRVNPDSRFIPVSNNNYQAFNELIHIGVEQGVIGILLFLLIIFTCLKSRYFPLVFAWCVFALFSYPADIPLLMIVFIASIALSSSRETIRFRIDKKWFLCMIVVLPFALKMHVKYNFAFENMAFATSPQLPTNMKYMLKFAALKQDILIFEEMAKNVCVSTEILCDMGDNYMKNKDINRADSCYQLARCMVPCRIVALHKLFLLYQKTDSIKAHHYAMQIINFQSTAIGSTILRALTDAKIFLNHE